MGVGEVGRVLADCKVLLKLITGSNVTMVNFRTVVLRAKK
jgi:hypothetical protein